MKNDFLKLKSGWKGKENIHSHKKTTITKTNKTKQDLIKTEGVLKITVLRRSRTSFKNKVEEKSSLT